MPSLRVCLLETVEDEKQVIKWNMGKLYDLDPKAYKERDEEINVYFATYPRHTHRDAKLYSRRIMTIARNIPKDSLPRNRKRFIRWLVDALELAFEEADDLVNEPNSDGVNFIIDWIDGARVAAPEFEPLSYRQAYARSQQWHHEEFQADDDLKIKSEARNVAYTWPDGWSIVRVPAGHCDAEGRAMGHCVGTYADNVARGELMIFSLRSPEGKPHATIEVSGGHVNQIKGKQNKVPIDQYAQRIVKWLLLATEFEFGECSDFIHMTYNGTEPKPWLIELENAVKTDPSQD